jgi:hypothetical protein
MPPIEQPRAPGAIVRYRPLAKSESLAASPSLLDLAAPFGGSRLVFPRLLARGLARAERDGSASSVANAHARWYFGRSLAFWADPAALTLRLHDRVHDGRSGIQLSRHFLDKGDWTDIVAPVGDTVEHRETTELVEYGERYKRMPSFRRMVRRARRKKPVRRYGGWLDTEEKIHAYFRYFLDLIESINEHGLQERSSLKRMRVPVGADVRGAHALHQRNIGVAIAADGRLLRFLGGRHRLAIAQALGLAAIPVEIRFVHAEWLAGEVQRSGMPPATALQEWAKRAPHPASDAADRPPDAQLRSDPAYA